ncbi:MAG: YHS domain-containing protein [Ignavibacteriae bacterium]|nr:YHS domain-containing protein [Ignavibacteriota bacterium]
MKTKKLLFFAVLTAMFFVVNLSFSQINHKEGDCTKKCEKECTTTQGNQEKSDCPKECTSKTGNSQGIVSDTNKVCIVTGEKLDGSEGEPIKLTYLGKEYLFCCNGCVKKFKAEPMNYIKGELKCPVMGEAADKNVSTVVDGVKYYFCCSSCIKKFEKEPQKYLNKQ